MVPCVYAKDVDTIELINCTWTGREGVFVYHRICDLILNTTVSDLFIYYILNYKNFSLNPLLFNIWCVCVYTVPIYTFHFI